VCADQQIDAGRDLHYLVFNSAAVFDSRGRPSQSRSGGGEEIRGGGGRGQRCDTPAGISVLRVAAAQQTGARAVRGWATSCDRPGGSTICVRAWCGRVAAGGADGVLGERTGLHDHRTCFPEVEFDRSTVVWFGLMSGTRAATGGGRPGRRA